MVARIDTSATLSDVLNYNEKKVAQNDAMLIHASGFLKDPARMSFYEKSERFQRQNELHPNSESNTLHASLNFDPSESLTDAQLAKIADRYMEGLGMQDHPYLVYRHTDASHPHVHIVSTLIDAEGHRLKTNNIGRNQSTVARMAIEREFGLVRANDRMRQEVYQVKPVDVEKLRYGNTQDTKKAMRNVLLMANQNYKFTSISEYNAILRQWNVYADRGSKNSRMYKRHGLVYRVIDEEGKKIGVPIKASSYHFKATLAELEKKFAQHQEGRKGNLDKMRNKVDEVLSQGPTTLPELADLLRQKGIEAVIYHGKDDRVYGITFVDNQLRTAAKSSDLGKNYGVTGLLKTIATGKTPPLSPGQQQRPAQAPAPKNTPKGTPTPKDASSPSDNNQQSLSIPQPLSHLLRNETPHGVNPQELQQDQQKRKRKKL